MNLTHGVTAPVTTVGTSREVRRRIIALALAAPAALAVMALLAVEAYRLVSPASILFVEPPADSLADALQRREVEVAYAFIRDGQDPNQVLRVQDAVLTGGRTVEVSPLTLAVASRNRNAVMMLLSAGARADLPANRFAACLAREIGETDLERMIVRDGGGETDHCPQPTAASGPPLLNYVSE